MYGVLWKFALLDVLRRQFSTYGPNAFDDLLWRHFSLSLPSFVAKFGREGSQIDAQSEGTLVQNGAQNHILTKSTELGRPFGPFFYTPPLASGEF